MNKRSLYLAIIFIPVLIILVTNIALNKSTSQGEVAVEFYYPNTWSYYTTDIEDSNNVYHLTTQVLDSNNIPYATEGYGDTIYITSIFNHKAGEHGSYSGWLYTVNGESPTVGAGLYTVEPGDTITWTYQLDE